MANQATPVTLSNAGTPLPDKSGLKPKPPRRNGKDGLVLVDFSNTAMVIFKVGSGDNMKTFALHKDTVCANSPVCDKALNSDMIEGQTQQYELDDVSPSVFQLLAQWMYYQGNDQSFLLKFHKGSDEPSDIQDLEHSNSCQQQSACLLGLWILADRLLMPTLQNDVMQQLHTIAMEGYALSIYSGLNDNYQTTKEDSPLRLYLLHLCVWHTNGDFKATAHLYTKEVVVDLVQTLLSAVPAKTLAKNRESLEVKHFFAGESRID